MGWLTMPLSSMYPHTTAKEYLDAQFTYSRDLEDGSNRALRVIGSSCLRNQVYYAAAIPSTNRVDEPAFAIVCLVRWNPRDKEGFVFGYKDMTEHVGPCEAECPQRILELLGDTDDPSALVWRRRCIDNLARARRRLEHGMKIKLATPVSFTDGYAGDEFTVHKQGRSIRLARPGSTYAGYRITNLRQLAWTPIVETRVHKTMFG